MTCSARQRLRKTRPRAKLRSSSADDNQPLGNMDKAAESREAELVQNARGKWGKKGVPHKGWICVEIEDLGSPDKICDMCESQEIRYAHHMEHQGYPDVLVVGCICAGNMEQDLHAAKARDSQMRSRFSKRKRWLSRKWKISKKGNPWITSDGYRVTVYRKDAGWGATISAVDKPYVVHSRRAFPNVEGAKLSAFDAVTSLLVKSSG